MTWQQTDFLLKGRRNCRPFCVCVWHGAGEGEGVGMLLCEFSCGLPVVSGVNLAKILYNVPSGRLFFTTSAASQELSFQHVAFDGYRYQ